MYPLSYKHRILYNFSSIGDLICGYPLELSNDSGIEPLFIIGSGRSGNTLLRAMLTKHGDYIIPPESYVLGRAILEYRIINCLPWKYVVKYVFYRFQRHKEFRHWRVDLCNLFHKVVNTDESLRCLAVILDSIYRYYGEKHFPSGKYWGDKTPMNV